MDLSFLTCNELLMTQEACPAFAVDAQGPWNSFHKGLQLTVSVRMTNGKSANV